MRLKEWIIGCGLACGVIATLIFPNSAMAANCPSGYHKDGNYCVANSGDSKAIIPKSGSCPSGRHSDGDWCVSNN